MSPMTELVILIPEELKQELDEFPEINWALVVQRFLKQEVEKILEIKRIVSKSKMTEEDALELGRKVNEGLYKRYKELYPDVFE